MKKFEALELLTKLGLLMSYVMGKPIYFKDQSGADWKVQAEKPIKNQHLNYALSTNLERLQKVQEKIQKGIDPELTALQDKISALGIPKAEVEEKGGQKETKIEDAPKPQKELTFEECLKLADPKDAERQKELYQQYLDSLDDDCEAEIYYINPSKIEDEPFDMIISVWLNKFMKPEG